MWWYNQVLRTPGRPWCFLDNLSDISKTGQNWLVRWCLTHVFFVLGTKKIASDGIFLKIGRFLLKCASDGIFSEKTDFLHFFLHFCLNQWTLVLAQWSNHWTDPLQLAVGSAIIRGQTYTFWLPRWPKRTRSTMLAHLHRSLPIFNFSYFCRELQIFCGSTFCFTWNMCKSRGIFSWYFKISENLVH